jgi:uncharacterized protein YutE (UPF0331/DUF86 family)
MLKPDVILRLLESLDWYVTHLRPFQKLSIKEMTNDYATYWAIQHGLQIAAQHVMDIGTHLLAAAPLAVPDDYKQVILEMGRHGILPYEFAEHISGMAGFRNVIEHQYLSVDPQKVYDVMQNHLDDFVAFQRHISNYLRREGYLADKEPHV